jgi:hypothetical protein
MQWETLLSGLSLAELGAALSSRNTPKRARVRLLQSARMLLNRGKYPGDQVLSVVVGPTGTRSARDRGLPGLSPHPMACRHRPHRDVPVQDLFLTLEGLSRFLARVTSADYRDLTNDIATRGRRCLQFLVHCVL